MDGTLLANSLFLKVRLFSVIFPLQINMSLGQINKRKILGLYSPSGVFELKKIYGERHEAFDPCCDEKFADVT